MLTQLLHHLQDYDPATKQHSCPRTLREYAKMLGVSHVTLVQVYSGDREAGGKVIRGLFRAFPDQAEHISAALTAPVREDERVSA